ncbi:MAG: FimB/Mfa2 family fimbrial subunit [Prevotella sp.]|nr:FimB/Mfa2 family fimbrial subunit [Prevotella sp.]
MSHLHETILACLAAAMLASCEKAIEQQTSATTGRQTAVTVYTRGASDAAIDLPVHVYAFDKDGALRAAVTLQPGSDAMQLALHEGMQYRVVAVAADETLYNLPAEPTLASVITLKTDERQQGGGYVTSAPLQMGFADITPAAQETSLHIKLGYQHCSFSAVLANMPDDCSSATVTVAQTYAEMGFDGQMNGNTTATIPCQKTGDAWQTGEVYLFPTTGQQTVFTVSFTDSDSQYSSSATYRDILHAGVHYIIGATYAEGAMLVSGNVSAPEWTSTVNLDFSFGNDTQTVVNGGTGTHGADDVVAVTDIPAAATVWNDHVVAAVLDDQGESLDNTEGLAAATLLLLSLNDWPNVVSAANADNPSMAADIAAGYSEYDMGDWTIPTHEQAALLTQAYGDGLPAALTEAEASPVVLTKGSSNVRYLCSDATETFRFNDSGILSAGTTVKYHLRLVRQVKVAVTR